MKNTSVRRSQFDQLIRLSWPWRITLGYLTIMLLLPVAALVEGKY